MISTRPDISFAVTTVSQFAANPSSGHTERAKYILHHLVGTQNYMLKYSHKGTGLGAYTDSDWAADKIQCWSVTGFLFEMAGGCISWHNHAQKTVALSSTKADRKVEQNISTSIITLYVNALKANRWNLCSSLEWKSLLICSLRILEESSSISSEVSLVLSSSHLKTTCLKACVCSRRVATL